MKKLKLFAKGMTIMIGLIAFLTGSAFADIVIKNGATMRVTSGTSVTVTTDVSIEAGGTVNNSGTVTVRGDFINDGTADLGSGSVIFDGTLLQTIGGGTTSEFEDLRIDNAAGVNMNIHAQVDGTLTLTDGLLTIGTSNLIFGTTAAAVAGTPSSSNMIVANNTGQVRKLFASGAAQNPAAFIFTVGDATNYTPISLDFNLVDVAAGGYAGINLTASKEPNNTSTDNFIDRYWTFVASGLTNYNYDFTATYADGDINGVEADMNGALYDGSGWLIGNPANAGANQISGTAFTDDGNVTGVEFRSLANVSIFCEGPYNGGSGEMTTVLNVLNFIPLDAATAYSHMGYTGTEAVGAIPNGDVVDWVLIELRDATSAPAASSATIVETVAAFLLKDGSIVNLDGASPVTFKSLLVNDAYFVVKHRNHLAVMTATSPPEFFGNYSYDFSDAITKAYGTDPMKQIGSAPDVFGLYAGDVNASIIITHADKEDIDLNMNFFGYHNGDCNFSGIITNADKEPIDLNINKWSSVPF